MSLNSILNIAASGLSAAQSQINVVSDNVANVQTPGYIRKVASQESVNINGIGDGVNISQVQLASDQFLDTASRNAASDSAQSAATSQYYGNLQTLFGDPSSSSSFFGQVTSMFTAFQTAAETPTSTAARQTALTQLQTVFGNATQIANNLQTTRAGADAQIGQDVTQANALLGEINNLNVEISRTSVSGGDATGAQNQQSQLLDQLSKLMNINIAQRSTGGVTVRTGDGQMLVGDGVATLAYQPASVVTSTTAFNQITITQPSGIQSNLNNSITSGEISGLLNYRDTSSVQAASQFGEYVSQIAAAVNGASNASSAVPPPNTLTGQNTNQDINNAIGGFTGSTNIAIVSSSGVLVNSIGINFSTGAITNSAGSTYSFSPSTFISTLNTALGSDGSASFSNGVLSLQATSASNGVAIADDPSSPSSSGGRSFSAFFGLNNLVNSSVPSIYQTGLTSSSTLSFVNSGTIKFQISNPNVSGPTDISVSVPSSPTMSSLLSSLNSTSSGVGNYGSFSLDSNGTLSFTPSSSQTTLQVVSDSTTINNAASGGANLTSFFGLDDGTKAFRAGSFSVNSTLLSNPTGLPFAQLDTTAATGSVALSSGDGSGATAIANALTSTRSFSAAGGAAAVSTSVDTYGSTFGGDIGSNASNATQQAKATAALSTQADSARSASEGVNLDQELVNMTTYQQAYNASSRLIQAAEEMYTTLIGMIQ